MDKTAHIASQLYTNAQNIARPEKPEEGKSDLFAQIATDFMDTMRAGEVAAQEGMVGKADAHSVVMALAASELAIETAVTVRDKVVEAYQEILRMPV